MMNVRALYQLARFDRPVGTLLLWAPTAWALWQANAGAPPWFMVLLLALGTVFMRAAGCVMNDIADRHIDPHVKRTKQRPLASGRISLEWAFLMLIMLLVLSLGVLIFLPRACFYYALAALGISGLYPFCKRYISGPQFVLSVAFSMGMPMAYVASGVAFSQDLALLMIINMAWIVMYDTQYAMADKKDDVHIGVRSTAILFGRFEQPIRIALQVFIQGAWLFFAATTDRLHMGFMLCWLVGTVLFIMQSVTLYQSSERYALVAFKSNGYYGLVMWMAFMVY